MAGRQGQQKARSQKGSGGAKKRSSAKGGEERRPGEYAREAASEWARAARLSRAALARGAKRATSRIGDRDGRRGGLLGSLADWVLSKAGLLGKAGSKVGLGSRVVKRLRENGGGADRDESKASVEPKAPVEGNGAADLPIPIQESIEVAVPVSVAYELCSRVEDYPEFLDHVLEVEPDDDDHIALVVKAHGLERRVELEIFHRRENQRIDWRGTDGVEHEGVVTFHPLAPRLTHIELSIDVPATGIVERISRRIHLPDRALHDELRRFKAYAELADDPEEEEEPEEGDEEEYDDEEEGPEGEQEEDFEEEEEDFEEEGEPEPAASG